MGRTGGKKEDAKKDPLSALDRTYYECEIDQLTKKLSHLRSYVAEIDKRKEEMEERMRELEEDRVDVTAHLDRTLHVQENTIKDLEEKLIISTKMRESETKEFQRQIKEWELKFKIMQEELTSEIKLLTGKLETLEEFQAIKDELMVKFNKQENELKEQSQRHMEILYDMERKQVIDKDRLKKEVENKLLELSNEFAKSNEIRISAHVQRLVRENIALNNELDRMMFSQQRLQSENVNIHRREVDRRAIADAVQCENEILIKACDSQLEVIKKIIKECEVLKEDNMILTEKNRLREHSLDREKSAIQALNDYKYKVHLLEQYVHSSKVECDEHLLSISRLDADNARLLNAFQKFKLTVKMAMRSQNDPCDDPLFRENVRISLLTELMNILNAVENGFPVIQSLETIASISKVYLNGDVGITPGQPMETILGLDQVLRLSDNQYDWKNLNAPLLEMKKKAGHEIYDTCSLNDLGSGTDITFSESSMNDVADAPPDDQLDDEAEDFGISSSEDEAQQPGNE